MAVFACFRFGFVQRKSVSLGIAHFKTQTYNLQYEIGVVSFEFSTLEIGFLDNLNNSVSRHPLPPLQRVAQN